MNIKAMDSGDFLALVFLFGLGTGYILAGTLYISGRYKSPYFFPDERQLIVSKMGIGLGSTFLLLGLAVLIAIQFPHSYFSTYTGSSLLIGSALLMPLANVLWLMLGVKPRWVKWLEQEHSNAISLLREKALEMGLSTWNAQVSTQKQLEDWVNEVLKEQESKMTEVKPYLPPRDLCPIRDREFKIGDKVIWERHDGQRFFGVVAKITPQNRIRIAYPEGGFTVVKPENVYHVE